MNNADRVVHGNATSIEYAPWQVRRNFSADILCPRHGADLMAAQGAFGTEFYDRYILRPKHRAYYCSGRPVIKIGSKGALGSHENRPIHSAPSLGQSIAS